MVAAQAICSAAHGAIKQSCMDIALIVLFFCEVIEGEWGKIFGILVYELTAAMAWPDHAG